MHAALHAIKLHDIPFRMLVGRQPCFVVKQCMHGAAISVHSDACHLHDSLAFSPLRLLLTLTYSKIGPSAGDYQDPPFCGPNLRSWVPASC